MMGKSGFLGLLEGKERSHFGNTNIDNVAMVLRALDRS